VYESSVEKLLVLEKTDVSIDLLRLKTQNAARLSAFLCFGCDVSIPVEDGEREALADSSRGSFIRKKPFFSRVGYTIRLNRFPSFELGFDSSNSIDPMIRLSSSFAMLTQIRLSITRFIGCYFSPNLLLLIIIIIIFFFLFFFFFIVRMIIHNHIAERFRCLMSRLLLCASVRLDAWALGYLPASRAKPLVQFGGFQSRRRMLQDPNACNGSLNLGHRFIPFHV
jgi:hypothetical protein